MKEIAQPVLVETLKDTPHTDLLEAMNRCYHGMSKQFGINPDNLQMSKRNLEEFARLLGTTIKVYNLYYMGISVICNESMGNSIAAVSKGLLNQPMYACVTLMSTSQAAD